MMDDNCGYSAPRESLALHWFLGWILEHHPAVQAMQKRNSGARARSVANGRTNVSFGSELRQQREERSIGLAEIAAATKLSERYLRALEADDHSELPGGIFNKGMVRGYCRHLGLDEQQWLARFAASCETQGGEPDWSAFAENVKAARVRTGASRGRWWGVLLMLLALSALGWAAWHYIWKQPAHFTSMKNEFGDCTRRFSLCFCFSRSAGDAEDRYR